MREKLHVVLVNVLALVAGVVGGIKGDAGLVQVMLLAWIYLEVRRDA